MQESSGIKMDYTALFAENFSEGTAEQEASKKYYIGLLEKNDLSEIDELRLMMVVETEFSCLSCDPSIQAYQKQAQNRIQPS